MTGFPALRWTAPGGRRRWTPVIAFMTASGESARTAQAKERSVHRLRRWAADGRQD
ncbi:hypothetical protein AB0M28_08265 [Streptomyces sp. NPDC051940]|uniref:hypothetical protein n=1 Tax=Streptomyces sp. NPDC051940 TaxID=3155675 RepID=UPI00343AA7D5